MAIAHRRIAILFIFILYSLVGVFAVNLYASPVAWLQLQISPPPNESVLLLSQSQLINVLYTAFIALGAYTLRQISNKAKVWDDHVKTCNEKAVQEGKETTRLEHLEAQIVDTNETVSWLGDVMIQVGTKLGAKLPDRPTTKAFERQHQR